MIKQCIQDGLLAWQYIRRVSFVLPVAKHLLEGRVVAVSREWIGMRAAHSHIASVELGGEVGLRHGIVFVQDAAAEGHIQI